MDSMDSLEHQLRSVRHEAAPAGLYERLIADIQESPVPISRNQWRQWAMPLTTVAAAIFIIASVMYYSRNPSTENRERSVAADYVFYHPTRKQETDPCSILPPLPESSHF